MNARRVLVVDDAGSDLTSLEKIIAHAGYVVLTATSGEQAVETAKAEKPDVILIDVNRKTVDGFEATRILQSTAATKDIPVIFVTAKHQAADRVWARMLGAKDFLTKPYTAQQVLAQLRAL